MANTYKNIVITPNRDTAENVVPFIQFSGGNTSVNTDINLRVYTTQSGTLSFEGSAGQLFSITNDLTGSIFSVNDISGIPSIDVNANGFIQLAPYGGNVSIAGNALYVEDDGTVQIAPSGGSIGMGTSNPYPLTTTFVSGRDPVAAYDGSYFGGGAYWAGATFRNTVGSQGGWVVRNTGGNFTVWTNWSAGAANSSIALSERFRIDGNGQIGINTSSPTSNLHVVGNTNITSNLTMGGGITFGSATSGAVTDLTRHIALWGDTGTSAYGFSITGNQLNYNASGTANHVFYIGGTERVRANSTGLHVVNGINVASVLISGVAPIPNTASVTFVGTAATALTATSATSAGTFTSTTQNSQFNSLGIGTAASAVAGSVIATTYEVGATDTTISRSSAGVIAVEGVVVPTISSTNTLTNKRVTPRVDSYTLNGATPSINTDTTDIFVITGQTVNITSLGATGTPTNGQTLRVALTSGSGTPTIAWSASFESSTAILPTTMSTTRKDVGFVWNAATSKWRCIAVA